MQRTGLVTQVASSGHMSTLVGLTQPFSDSPVGQTDDWMGVRVPGCGLQRYLVDRSASPHWLLAGHGWCCCRIRGSFPLWLVFYKCRRRRNCVFCYEDSSTFGLVSTLENFTQLSHEDSRENRLHLCTYWMEFNIVQLKNVFNEWILVYFDIRVFTKL